MAYLECPRCLSEAQRSTAVTVHKTNDGWHGECRYGHACKFPLESSSRAASPQNPAGENTPKPTTARTDSSTDEKVEVKCPTCGQALRVPRVDGKKLHVRCPNNCRGFDVSFAAPHGHVIESPSDRRRSRYTERRRVSVESFGEFRDRLRIKHYTVIHDVPPPDDLRV